MSLNRYKFLEKKNIAESEFILFDRLQLQSQRRNTKLAMHTEMDPHYQWRDTATSSKHLFALACPNIHGHLLHIRSMLFHTMHGV